RAHRSPATRCRGAARAERLRLWAGQGDREFWRRNGLRDPEVRTRPQAAGDRANLGAAAARARRAHRAAAGVGATPSVMAGLVPAINVLFSGEARRGCP